MVDSNEMEQLYFYDCTRGENTIMRVRKYFILLLSVVLFAGLVGCASTPTSESTGQYLDNTVITAKVKSQLLGKLGGQSVGIKVKSYKNDVQLSGFVDDVQTVNEAEAITLEVPGVKTVHNNIMVKTED